MTKDLGKGLNGGRRILGGRLGQDILDNNPRASILGWLELTGWTFDDLLAALNLAAEAARTRALIVIDALNEGRGTEVWRNHLSGFIAEVNKHDRIVLVMSCREEYLDYVVPKGVIGDLRPYPDEAGRPKDCEPLGELVRVEVSGFRTTAQSCQEEAEGDAMFPLVPHGGADTRRRRGTPHDEERADEKITW